MNENEVIKELGRVFCKGCSYMELVKKKDIELQAMRNAAKAERAEAIKEFAERWKKNFDTYTDEEEANVLYIRKLIDNIVKEMTEGK